MKVWPSLLDLFLRQGAVVDPAQSLAFHQLAQQLDDREHELSQTPLQVLRVGIQSPSQRLLDARQAAPQEVQVGRTGEELVVPHGSTKL